MTVLFVGAAFGDPALLTAGAAEALAACDVVVHDADVAAAIVSLARERIAAAPMLLDRVAQMEALTAEGKSVVRLTREEILLKEGGEDEVETLAQRGVAFELAPSIALETAVMAFCGIPLTRGGDVSPSFASVRARSAASLALLDWASLTNATDTLMITTTRGTLDEVVAALLYHARSPDTPVLVVLDLGRPTQRVQQGVLSDIATRARRLPGEERLLVVGNTVARRGIMKWFDGRPLFGKRVLVTRTEEQAKKTVGLLRARGAEAVSVPAIVLRPLPHDIADVSRAYDYVAFTSSNTVSFVWDELLRRGKDARVFGGVRIAALGSSTAKALEACGLRADLVAKDFRGEGLAAGLLEEAGDGKRLLLPRAKVARETLPETLRARGWTVDVMPVYETEAPPVAAFVAVARELERGAIDAVTFTSKSTVDHLLDGLERVAQADAAASGSAPTPGSGLLSRAKIACIGPVTRDAAEARGLRVDLTASPYTIDALILALEQSFR
jgi:uroporphyrinogen III methyltransferase/synthase